MIRVVGVDNRVMFLQQRDMLSLEVVEDFLHDRETLPLNGNCLARGLELPQQHDVEENTDDRDEHP